jgi:tetratricopeptide (TPR) repeat protein
MTGSPGHSQLWAVGSWQEGPRLSGLFSPDGRVIADSPARGVLRLTRVGDGRELARLEDPNQDDSGNATFSADGARIVTTNNNTGSIHVWDLREIRRELDALGLDWDDPPLRPARAAPGETLQIQVDRSGLREIPRANQLVLQANQLVHDKEHAQALACLREAVKLNPAFAEAHNNLAWLLLTGPEAVRDPREALPHARNADELSHGRAVYKNTLGVALYRNGQFKEAVPVLQQSLEAGKGQQDAFDLFFLAMCQHRLGNATDAKKCYDQAAAWFRERRGKLPPSWVEELTAFEAEARALLEQPNVVTNGKAAR